MSDHAKFILYRRSNGVYYIIIETGGKRKYKSTGCTRKSEALKALTNYKALFAERLPVTRLSEFVQKFIPFAETNVSRATLRSYKLTLGNLLDFMGDCPLASITPRRLDEYKIERAKSVSPVSVNIELRTLRAAFNVMVRWRLLDRSPFREVSFIRIPDRAPDYLDRNDFDRLLGTIKEKWLQEVVVVAVLTGMRLGELLHLRWTDVNFEQNMLIIQSAGDFRTKHGKMRTIPLNDVARRLLTELRERTESELVFPSCGRRYSDSWVSHRFKRYARMAGLSAGIHFHSLRHTFATWLVQKGTSIYTVQKLMGHSSIAVTQVYAHLATPDLQTAVNALAVPIPDRLSSRGNGQCQIIPEKSHEPTR